MDKCSINLQGFAPHRTGALENTCYLGSSFLLKQGRINHVAIFYTHGVVGECYQVRYRKAGSMKQVQKEVDGSGSLEYLEAFRCQVSGEEVRGWEALRPGSRCSGNGCLCV